ncbi:Uncharacterised protein [Legionella pneumophila]|nr:Uncharacterised protein [Legionella pneumophila]
MTMGTTLSFLAKSLRLPKRERTDPSTTGPIISKCEGLNAKARCTIAPDSVFMSEEKPR